MGTALVVWKSHDVLGLLLFGLSLEVPGSGGDDFSGIGKERQDVEMRIIEDRVLAILSIDGS